MSVKDALNQKIKEKPVFIISKKSCPFCVKAKDALKKYKIRPECLEIMEIDKSKAMGDIQDYMGELTGGRSVPRVFVGGKFIGGGDETLAAHKKGKLQKMLENAGAL
jgi:glutaredoxin 3